MSEDHRRKAVAAALTLAKLDASQKVAAPYQKALGKLTMEFSLLHFSLERFSWEVWNLTEPMAQILTKDLQLKNLTVKLRASAHYAISKIEHRKQFSSILSRVEAVAEKRNELLHSLWIIAEHGPVLCVSRKRGRLEGPDAPSVEQINALSLTILEILVDFSKFKKKSPLAKGLFALGWNSGTQERT